MARSEPSDPNIRSVLDRLHEDGQRTTPTSIDQKPLYPPGYGAPQRDAVASIVDGIVDDFCRKLGEVRATLDKLEQQALQSAANAKGALNDHVAVCVRLNDEIGHMGAVVEELADTIKLPLT